MLTWLPFPSLHPTTPMKSKYPRSRRPFGYFLAVFVASASIAACGQFSEAALSEDATDDAGQGTSGGSGGQNGADHDGSIFVGPESGSTPALDPLAQLCGAGACVVGGGDKECEPTETCQLIPVSGTAIAECGPAGQATDGVVCNTAQDCSPGMGCAATPNSGGVCKSYCCGDPEGCPAKTYCAAQPMAEDTSSDKKAEIPVCIPAVNCELLSNKGCTDPSLVCSIVRADGTTSCIPPGEGELNEACPCAAGFVCSKLTNQCKKLCKVGFDEMYCGAMGACQAGSSGFPESFGVCVGGSSP